MFFKYYDASLNIISIFDIQFHCSIIFLITIFSEIYYLILRYNGPLTTNPSTLCNYCPQLRYTFNPRAIVFLMDCTRYHNLLWVDKSECLPQMKHNSFIIFVYSSNTYLIWNKQFSGENTNTITADSFLYSTGLTYPTTKKHYQSDNLFKEMWKRLSG